MMPNCPECKRNDAVRRSHRVALEPLLRLISLYPFRCEHCDARFYRFHKPEEGSRQHLKAKQR
jgi:hypothetical protein